MSLSSRSRLLVFALAATASALVLAWPAAAVIDEGGRGFRSQGHQPGGPAPADTATPGERAVKFALQVVGTPYRWAGESPESGFDCSGLVRWAYGRVGVDLPHSSYALYDLGRGIPSSKLALGDLLFFEGLGHVGLYAGKGRMVHAPQSGRTVEVIRLDAAHYGARLVGARRIAAS